MDTVTSVSGHKWTLLQALVDISGHCYKHYWTQVDAVTGISGHKWTLLQALVGVSGHCYKH